MSSVLDATNAETTERLGMIVAWLKALKTVDDAEGQALGESTARTLLLPVREQYLRQAHADLLARKKAL